MVVAAVTFMTLLTLSGITTAQQGCNRLWKHVDFSKHSGVTEYTETHAETDWLPSSYMDGYFGDPSTKGSTNERAFIRTDDQSEKALEVLLPKGCVTSACAFQTKSLLPSALDSATLSYMVKFGPNFDWVRGGKLPGLCGAKCLTGCKEVSGLDGWSSRNMWRPCVWPPQHPDKALKCSGGKLAAYVYHMFKDHWCGDDFDFSSDKFRSQASDGEEFNFFQPSADKWYHIQTHIRMNTAGDATDPANFLTDGVLKTWLDGELVVDKSEMAWRQYNNVTIDTLYFSVFFGGSSPSFQAKKDETIRFADFKIYEGQCMPSDAPSPLSSDQLVMHLDPTWEKMRPLVDTDLLTSTVFTKPYVGGGCGDIIVTNSGSACERWQVEISIRPEWGSLVKWAGLVLLDSETESGWSSLGPDTAKVTDTSLKPNETVRRARICVMTTLKAKYLPDQFADHVKASAYCVVRNGINVTPENAPVVEVDELPDPVLADNPDADTNEDTLPSEALTSNTDCTGSGIEIVNKIRPFGKKICITSTFTYTGLDKCTAFNSSVFMNDSGSRLTDVKSTRMTAIKDGVTGGVTLKSPIWFKGMECGESHTSQTCYYVSGAVDNPIESMVATCTSTEILEEPIAGDEEDEL
jgi:hypothetical protein